MKKKSLLLPILALVLAVGASAFTTVQKSTSTSLYWFVYDDVQETFVFDRHDETPSIECDGLGKSCSQGFEQPNGDGEEVYPGITMKEQNEKN
jgi:hypothetical protein